MFQLLLAFSTVSSTELGTVATLHAGRSRCTWSLGIPKSFISFRVTRRCLQNAWLRHVAFFSRCGFPISCESSSDVALMSILLGSCAQSLNSVIHFASLQSSSRGTGWQLVSVSSRRCTSTHKYFGERVRRSLSNVRASPTCCTIYTGKGSLGCHLEWHNGNGRSVYYVQGRGEL